MLRKRLRFAEGPRLLGGGFPGWFDFFCEEANRGGLVVNLNLALPHSFSEIFSRNSRISESARRGYTQGWGRRTRTRQPMASHITRWVGRVIELALKYNF